MGKKLFFKNKDPYCRNKEFRNLKYFKWLAQILMSTPGTDYVGNFLFHMNACLMCPHQSEKSCFYYIILTISNGRNHGRAVESRSYVNSAGEAAMKYHGLLCLIHQSCLLSFLSKMECPPIICCFCESVFFFFTEMGEMMTLGPK